MIPRWVPPVAIRGDQNNVSIHCLISTLRRTLRKSMELRKTISTNRFSVQPFTFFNTHCQSVCRSDNLLLAILRSLTIRNARRDCVSRTYRSLACSNKALSPKASHCWPRSFDSRASPGELWFLTRCDSAAQAIVIAIEPTVAADPTS